MKNSLNLNSQLISFMLTLRDFVVLNFLWIIFCIPIVTIGASTTALFSVTFKIVNDKDNYVGRQFLKAFRQNLKQSVLAEVFLVIPIAILGFGLFFWASFQSVIGTVISTLCIIFLCMLIGTAIFTFPLLSRYENTTKQTIKNALVFCMTYKLYTLIFIALIAGGGFLAVFTAPTAVLMCLFGFSFVAYIISLIMLRLFKKYDRVEEVSNLDNKDE